MQPKWKIKPFNALSLSELYEVLQLRAEIFIVEQDCVYQDIDGKDAKALHLIGEYDGRIVAYARLFKPGDYFDDASVGRVVVKQEFRDKKWGHDLMRESLKAIAENFGEGSVTISAQLYLQKFYEAHGFVTIGESYLEDDIPHIRMINMHRN
jgi:ElaA protein